MKIHHSRYFLAGIGVLLMTGAGMAGHDGYNKRYEYGHSGQGYVPPQVYAFAPPPVYGPGHPRPVSKSEIGALLAQYGFVRIYDIDKDDGVYEVEARHANGRKAEIEIDIATGRILEIDWD